MEFATAVLTDHPIGGRIVTTHGDFHGPNIIDMGPDFDTTQGNRYRVVDFEFTCVTHAIHDIAYGNAIANRTPNMASAFLTGYLEELTGETASDEDIRSLQVEAEIYTLTLCHSGGMLAPWMLSNNTEEEICELIAEIKSFCTFVRGSREA